MININLTGKVALEIMRDHGCNLRMECEGLISEVLPMAQAALIAAETGRLQ